MSYSGFTTRDAFFNSIVVEKLRVKNTTVLTSNNVIYENVDLNLSDFNGENTLTTKASVIRTSDFVQVSGTIMAPDFNFF
jgi:hypothetical protein